MNQEQTLEFMEHYGVKGMHWGIRNDKPRPSSGDYKTTKKYRNRHPQELTNKQLKAVNERLNLEQNYRRLNPSKVKTGAHVAKGILAGLTTAATVYNLTKSPGGKALVAAGKSFMKKKPPLKSTEYILKNLGK